VERKVEQEGERKGRRNTFFSRKTRTKIAELVLSSSNHHGGTWPSKSARGRRKSFFFSTIFYAPLRESYFKVIDWPCTCFSAFRRKNW
jgi:hypothetical protein